MLGWALTMRASNPIAATRATIEDLGVSGRVLVETIDSTKLPRPERRALSEHAAHLNEALSLVRRAEVYARYYYAGLTVVILLLGGVVIYASLRLGGHLSRQLSRPIDELVGWTGHIQRRRTAPRRISRGAVPRNSRSCAPRSARWIAGCGKPGTARSNRSGSAPSARWPAGWRTR